MTGSTAKEPSTVEAQMAQISARPLARWPERFPEARPFGYLNSHVPGEILHAAGFTPLHVFGNRRPPRHAETRLPGFTCWLVRSALDQAMGGDLDFLAGMAFAHTCDSAQALADIWRLAVPSVPVLTLGTPVHLSATGAREYLIAALGRFRRQVGALAGRPVTDDDLRASIALYNEIRRLVTRLTTLGDRLLSPTLLAALRAGHLTPPEIYRDLLAELVADLERRDAPVAPNAPRLIVVGAHLDDTSLYEAVVEAGGRVVGDLLDLGYVHHSGLAAETGDPLAALAERTLAQVPIAAKTHPGRRRDDALLALVRDHAADGVVFAPQKFCEPHGFDVVPLKNGLDRAGVPHLLVELEQAQVSGQIRTRLGAFIEMLG
jgi:benzoyl-CoA reductase/2-hydroxyglutaryl-CoA dehydratase subunit BcrC/BadD/HgdB